MKTFLIILSFIVGIWLLSKILKIFASSKNPIESTQFNSVMGIRIGDRWDFVLSRMLYVGLITKQDYKKYFMEYKELQSASPFERMCFEGFISTMPFNNIEHVRCQITRDILSQIEIQLTPEQTDIEFLEEKVIGILNNKLGKGTKNTDPNMTFWTNHQTANVYLSHELHTINVFDSRYKNY